MKMAKFRELGSEDYALFPPGDTLVFVDVGVVWAVSHGRKLRLANTLEEAEEILNEALNWKPGYMAINSNRGGGSVYCNSTMYDPGDVAFGGKKDK